MAVTAPKDQTVLYVYYHTPIRTDVADFRINVMPNGGDYEIILTSDILKNIPVDGYIFKYWMSGPIPEESTIYSVEQVVFKSKADEIHLHLYGFYEPIVKQKNIKARYQQKIDTEANWNKAVNFIPMKGEIIIYKDSDIVKEKIGDGITTVGNLKFNTDDTLAYSGVAADSKAVGDALADIYA